MKRTCEWCGIGIITTRADARFCSSKCRVYAHRAAKNNPIPRAMLERDRWVRRSASKVPLTITGDPASSTNPSTWASYTDASRSTVGVGLGYVLGDGIGCIDLDHVIRGGALEASADEIVARYPKSYIEISPSGDGLHIWGIIAEGPGTKRVEGGISIERYSTGRYITITHHVYQPGTLQPL